MTTEKTKLTYTDETNNIVVLEESEEVCRVYPIYQTLDKQSKIDFLLIIILAISREFGRPIKVLACPADKFPCSTRSKTSSGRDNNLKEFAM